MSDIPIGIMTRSYVTFAALENITYLYYVLFTCEVRGKNWEERRMLYTYANEARSLAKPSSLPSPSHSVI